MSRSGRWQASSDLDVVGTHVVLLREPQTNAAKVFLFGESGANQTMKLWRFYSSDSLRKPAISSADTTTVLVTVPHPDDLANDLFCNGHSILPDGRMMFIGGNYTPADPCQMVYLFDPTWRDTLNGSPWTLGAKMSAERWYATATALPDGKILGSAGEARSWLAAFGGRHGDGTTDRVLRPLTVAGQYMWADTTAVPTNSLNRPRTLASFSTIGRTATTRRRERITCSQASR